MNAVPWRRVYVDIPADVDEALATLARQRGVPKKKLLADLAVAACKTPSSKTTTSKEPKK